MQHVIYVRFSTKPLCETLLSPETGIQAGRHYALVCRWCRFEAHGEWQPFVHPQWCHEGRVLSAFRRQMHSVEPVFKVKDGPKCIFSRQEDHILYDLERDAVVADL